MLKCKASETPLPYGILITQIMQYSGIMMMKGKHRHKILCMTTMF